MRLRRGGEHWHCDASAWFVEPLCMEACDDSPRLSDSLRGSRAIASVTPLFTGYPGRLI